MSTYIPNGRGSAHSHIPYSAWQRHTPQCEARGFVTKKSGKPCHKCRASDATQEVRFYALTISVFMTRQHIQDRNGNPVRLSDMVSMSRDELAGATFVCPLTGKRVAISTGQADRVTPGHAGGRYEPGNLALVSAGANLAREYVDMDDSAYAASVMDAHKRVSRVIGIHEGRDMPSGYRAAVAGGSTAKGRPDVAGVENGPYGL